MNQDPKINSATPAVEFPWKCDECGTHVMWSYYDCANSGTPVCEECGADMVLDFVEPERQLSERDSLAVAEALFAPPEPNEALREAFAAHQKLIGE